MWINKKNGWKVISSAKTTFFHIHWKEKKKKSYKRLLTSANGAEPAGCASAIQHWKLKIKILSRACVCAGGKYAEHCGIYGARPCERKCSNKLSSWMLPLLNQLQLPPAHALSLQPLRSSPLPTTTITHISVIQFIVPFVRLQREWGRGGRGSEQLLTFCFIALPLNRLERRDCTQKNRFSLCFFLCEVA